MNFSQLDTLLEHTLTELNFEAFQPNQEKIINRLKQGGDFLLLGDAKSGKSTALGFGSIMKAPKAFEGSPRVLILTSTHEKAEQLHGWITEWIRRTEIVVEIAYDRGNMILQRNNIFDGTDIIVGNPKKILDLYIQSGLHVGQLNLFVIDDADEVCKDAVSTQRVLRLIESLPKCQRVISTTSINARLEKVMSELFTAEVTLDFRTQPA